MEQSCSENGSKKNFFFQKGFQGTDKSAFDILSDIFQDNDDQYFFQNYNDFGIPDNLKSTMKSFIDDNIFCHETERSTSFFESYKPTFVNPDFFMAPPMFSSTEVDDTCTTHFFSSLLANTGEQTYSRTSTTVILNGKVTTSTKDRFQNGTNLFEQEETNEYNPKKSKTNCNKTFDPIYIPNPIDTAIIILDDCDDDNICDPLFDFYQDIKSFTNCSSSKFGQGLKAQKNQKVNLASKKN